MRHLSPVLILLSGFVLTTACGGKAQDSGRGGDGDGDGPNGSGGLKGDGDLPGDGDGSGGTMGDGDAPGDGGSSQMYCEPGDARLCDVQADPACSGIGVQICAETGAEWGACVCDREAGGMGGSQNMGGAGGAGPGPGDDPEPSCPDGEACGGEVRGRWEVNSSCLEVDGKFDVSWLGIGCSEAAIWGELDVAGELEFLDDGRFLDETTTSGDLALRLLQECLDISGTIVTCEQISFPLASGGFSSVKCLDYSGGGCVCGARVNRAGGLGHVSPDASTSGLYTAIDETLTLSDSDAFTYSYCAAARSFVMTPTGVGDIDNIHGSVLLAPTAPLLWSRGSPSGDARP